MTTFDSLQPLQEEAPTDARKLPTRADVLKYYANDLFTVEPTVNPAAEVEQKISKINHLIDAELATNADLQPDLFFHGTNDQAWESIQHSGQFQITAGRASLTRTPTYSNERYAVQGSETNIIQTLQDTLPRFQAEGLVDTSGTIVEQLQQVNDLLSQPRFKEMYGRL